MYFIILTANFCDVCWKLYGFLFNLQYESMKVIIMQHNVEKIQKIAWIQSHHLHLRWKFKLWVAGKFAWGVNFPANHLNFHWRWLDQIQAIFLDPFYFNQGVGVIWNCFNFLFAKTTRPFSIISVSYMHIVMLGPPGPLGPPSGPPPGPPLGP